MVRGWMVRAGEGGYLISDFEKAGCVAIGWNELGDMSVLSDRDELREAIEKAYPGDKESQIRISVGQAYKFRFEIGVGDIVVSYNPADRIYIVGEALGGYKYEPGRVPDFNNIIPVKWLKEIPRDELSVETRNSLGAALSCFSFSDHVLQEFSRLLKGQKPETEKEPGETETELDVLRRDVIERANEFIKDEVLKLDWEEMQDLIAGILRAMGYVTKVSPRGPDRGKDVTASPDGLGIQQPRIRVEVKHRPGTKIEPNEIRSFIAGLRPHQIGLYVSTGGFTRESHYEAERAQTPVTLVGLDDLVVLYIQYYEKLDADAKALLPLISIYWPA
jgi:restriction system protein